MQAYQSNLTSNQSKITSKKIKNIKLNILCRQMGIMLESGCEITRIIEILKNQQDKNTKHVLQAISRDISNGSTISQSFENSNSFSPFFISMMYSGEVSGNLDKAMNDLADYYDKEEKIRSKINVISIYPKIVVILSILSMFLIMIFVIPRFEIIFISNGIDPPLLTKMLINISIFIRSKYTYIFIISLTSLPVLIHLIKNNNRINQINNYLKFKVPGIKNLTQAIVTSRFCKTLKMLIKSGVQVVEAIEISAKVVDSKYIYNKLLISREYIKNGNSIGYSLELSNVFPSVFISMINIGEESGRLEECLSTVDNFYSNDLEMRIEKIMKLIEPITIVILSIFVGMFLIAMVMPMFDAMTSI